jgi:hypothetical protein
MVDREIAPARGPRSDAKPADAPRGADLLIVGSAAGGVGGALTAVFSTLCCVAPSAFALAGTTGAGAAARLAPYRPLLVMVSLGFLAYGFWSAYGRPVIVGGPVRVGRFARRTLWFAAAAWVTAAMLPAS